MREDADGKDAHDKDAHGKDAHGKNAHGRCERDMRVRAAVSLAGTNHPRWRGPADAPAEMAAVVSVDRRLLALLLLPIDQVHDIDPGIRGDLTTFRG